MRPSLALSIGAVFNILAGLPVALASAPMLSVFGWPATPDQAIVLPRHEAILLIGVGIIDWLARDAVGAPLRALLWGNIFMRAAEGVVNGWEFATGIVPTSAYGGLLYPVALAVDIALILIFALALRTGSGPRARGHAGT
jgi:hypothetical protein